MARLAFIDLNFILQRKESNFLLNSFVLRITSCYSKWSDKNAEMVCSHILVALLAAHALILLVSLVRSDLLARVDYLLSKGALEGCKLALRSLLASLFDHILWKTLKCLVLIMVHVAFVDHGEFFFVSSVTS